MENTGEEHLKRVLKPIHLWAIGVGLVISGEYFGWNLGWESSGTIGLLIATLIITLMYITFIFSYTELTTAIPDAGGAFAYAYRAMGPIAGLVAGYATLVDFLFATPAIAYSLGAYLHFLYPVVSIVYSALFFNVVFIVINLIGVKESASFTVFVTILAVAELLAFMGIVAPHFKLENFMSHSEGFGWKEIFAGLPFAVWLYLGIEGVATVAEEVRDPEKSIRKGYLTGMFTLVLLALGVMILTGGITDWRTLTKSFDPLPEAIGVALGKTNGLSKLFAGLGLFGLIASFHSFVLASSRQVFSLARSGYLPRVLSNLNHKFQTPHWAMVAGGILTSLALFSGKINQVLIFSVLGALVMYITSMTSLFVLRYREPGLNRPFKSPFYPVFPGLAAAIMILATVAIIYYYFTLSLIFFGGLIVALLVFLILGKHKVKLANENLLTTKN